MRLHQTNLPPWEILMNVCSICCQLEKMHRSEDEEHMQDNLVFWLFDDFAKIKGKNIFAEHICIILARMRERSPRSERGRGTEDGLPDYSELCVVRGPSIIIMIILGGNTSGESWGLGQSWLSYWWVGVKDEKVKLVWKIKLKWTKRWFRFATVVLECFFCCIPELLRKCVFD